MILRRVFPLALIVSLGVLASPAWAQGSGTTNQSARNNPANNSTPLFSGPAQAAREGSIDGAIGELEALAGSLPKGDKRRADLEAAAEGLKRMRKNGRFRTKKKKDLKGDNPGANTEGPEQRPGDGEIPKGEKKPRDASEDSWIDFPEDHWEEPDENDPDLEDTVPSEYTGDSIPALAIILWHEWQHAADAGMTKCEDIKRHICIYKGQIKIAELFETQFPNEAKYKGLGHQTRRGADAPLTKLRKECKELEGCVCEGCDEEDPWNN